MEHILPLALHTLSNQRSRSSAQVKDDTATRAIDDDNELVAFVLESIVAFVAESVRLGEFPPFRDSVEDGDVWK